MKLWGYILLGINYGQVLKYQFQPRLKKEGEGKGEELRFYQGVSYPRPLPCADSLPHFVFVIGGSLRFGMARTSLDAGSRPA